MKKMTTMIIALSMVLLSTTAFAQKNNKRGGEKIEAMRVAFITTKLDLTPTESQNFWPVYNAYTKDLKTLRKNFDRKVDFKTMSDAEAEKFVNSSIEKEQRQLDLKRKYLSQFKDVLPIRKVALLNQVERQFKKKLLKEMKQRRGSKGDRSKNR